jgi:hypothetical protein
MTASTVAWGECPDIEPVSPSATSTYSLPSTSVTRAPCASARKTGAPPAHFAIPGIGTPCISAARARSARAKRPCVRRGERLPLPRQQCLKAHTVEGGRRGGRSHWRRLSRAALPLWRNVPQPCAATTARHTRSLAYTPRPLSMRNWSYRTSEEPAATNRFGEHQEERMI